MARSRKATYLLGDMPPQEELIFQQVGDLKQNFRATKSFLASKNIKCMERPAQSPDLNPKEYLWSELKRRLQLYLENPKGVGKHWARVGKEWTQVSAGTCQTLIGSMPGRIEAVVKAKGGHARYWNRCRMSGHAVS